MAVAIALVSFRTRLSSSLANTSGGSRRRLRSSRARSYLVSILAIVRRVISDRLQSYARGCFGGNRFGRCSLRHDLQMDYASADIPSDSVRFGRDLDAPLLRLLSDPQTWRKRKEFLFGVI